MCVYLLKKAIQDLWLVSSQPTFAENLAVVLELKINYYNSTVCIYTPIIMYTQWWTVLAIWNQVCSSASDIESQPVSVRYQISSIQYEISNC
jgi:hypothetical protein